jgi:hypothetical protein
LEILQRGIIQQAQRIGAALNEPPATRRDDCGHDLCGCNHLDILNAAQVRNSSPVAGEFGKRGS